MTATPSPWYQGTEPSHHLTTAGATSCGQPPSEDLIVSTAVNGVTCDECLRILARAEAAS